MWTTATEINNDFFIVERLNKDGSFSSVDWVGGAGNSNQELEYNGFDRQPEYGINYYRLKQTDYNGTYTYSEVISVEYQPQFLDVNLYPNPSDGSQITLKCCNM